MAETSNSANSLLKKEKRILSSKCNVQIVVMSIVVTVHVCVRVFVKIAGSTEIRHECGT